MKNYTITPKERTRRALLKILDARKDVTVQTRTWPVRFVQLRHCTRKWIMNEDGFNPQHREAALFYGQAFEAIAGTKIGVVHIDPVPALAAGGVAFGKIEEAIAILDPMSDAVAVALGLRKPSAPKIQVSLER